MKIIFLKKALPKPDGCCGIEVEDESIDIEKNILDFLRKTSEEGRLWVNTINVYEELGGRRKLIVYNFPNNIKIAEKYKIKLPALIIEDEVIEEIDEKKLKAVYKKIEKPER